MFLSFQLLIHFHFCFFNFYETFLHIFNVLLDFFRISHRWIIENIYIIVVNYLHLRYIILFICDPICQRILRRALIWLLLVLMLLYDLLHKPYASRWKHWLYWSHFICFYFRRCQVCVLRKLTRRLLGLRLPVKWGMLEIVGLWRWSDECLTSVWQLLSLF